MTRSLARTLVYYLCWGAILVMAAIGLLSTLIMVVAIDYRDSWCTGDQCTILGVLGSLSGWAAAAGAAATVGVLLSQLQSQRRQEQFVVGLALPTAALFVDTVARPDEDFNRIRIVNWNRNPVSVETIRLKSKGTLLSGLQSIHMTAIDSTLPAREADIRLNILGWENRSERPGTHYVDPQLVTSEPATFSGTGKRVRREPVTIELVICVHGDRIERHVLTTSYDKAVVARDAGEFSNKLNHPTE